MVKKGYMQIRSFLGIIEIFIFILIGQMIVSLFLE